MEARALVLALGLARVAARSADPLQDRESGPARRRLAVIDASPTLLVHHRQSDTEAVSATVGRGGATTLGSLS